MVKLTLTAMTGGSVKVTSPITLVPLPPEPQHTLKFFSAEVAVIASDVTAALVRAHSAATVSLKLTTKGRDGVHLSNGDRDTGGMCRAITTLPKS